MKRLMVKSHLKTTSRTFKFSSFVFDSIIFYKESKKFTFPHTKTFDIVVELYFKLYLRCFKHQDYLKKKKKKCHIYQFYAF